VPGKDTASDLRTIDKSVISYLQCNYNAIRMDDGDDDDDDDEFSTRRQIHRLLYMIEVVSHCLPACSQTTKGEQLVQGRYTVASKACLR